MRLHKIISGELRKLENKEYQIGIGISLGNKWFTVDNIVELTRWCLDYSKDKVIVYVADSIHAINLEVRKQISREKAEKIADEMGTNILIEVEMELKNVLDDLEFERIVFAKWKDLTNEVYKNKVAWLYDKYEKDLDFSLKIQKIVSDMVSNEIRNFSDDEIKKLGTYILEELPECLYQVKMKTYECQAWVYQYATGPLMDFIEEIQQGNIYPEIKEKIIDTEPKVLLEVR